MKMALRGLFRVLPPVHSDDLGNGHCVEGSSSARTDSLKVILQITHPGHSDDLGNEVSVQSSVSQKCNGFEFDVLGPL